MATKFFAVDPMNKAIGSFDSYDAAAGACQDAAREANEDGEGYEVVVAGSVEIVEVSPNIGECSDDEYDDGMKRLEDCYTKYEENTRYTVHVRRAREGEPDGVYMVLPNGDLQILGGSVEEPEDLCYLRERAWEMYCEGAYLRRTYGDSSKEVLEYLQECARIQDRISQGEF